MFPRQIENSETVWGAGFSKAVIYITTTGMVKKIDEYGKVLIMDSGEVIPLEHMTGLEGDFLKNR